MNITKMMKRKGRLAVLTASFVILILFSGCERIKTAYGNLINKDAGAAGAPPEAAVYAVNTTTAAQGPIRNYLALSGDIVAASTVDTFPEAAGKVSRLYVSVGDRVRKEDPVADVDPSRPGMTYVASVVKAPVSGIVVALPAQMGMTVSTGVSLARIAAGSALEIKLYVAERFLSRVGLRQPCDITLDAFPGEMFQGIVTEMSPVIDPASRTMEVTIGVNNAGSRLKPGMFAKVKIITERKSNIVKIPAGAMVQRFGRTYVFVVEPDPDNPQDLRARERAVTPGILIDGVLEIERGLEADEEIVVRGQTLLEDGSRINVVDRVPPISSSQE
jgi:multidrug efflux pump subunit AcrA (membrane-fusion protein)